MRALSILLAGGMFSAAAVAADFATYSRNIAVGPQDRIEISNVAGTVAVTAWDRPEVDVQARLGSDIERVEVERHQGAIEVRVVVRQGMFKRSGNNMYAHLQVRVPAANSLEVSTVSAGLGVDGGHGKIRLKTVSGGVRADVQSNDLEIQTVSGRIILRSGGSNARLRATTVSGGIELSNVSGEVEARTTSGSVNVNADAARVTRLHTVSGSIEFRGKLPRDASFEAESVSGRVVMKPVAEAGYRYEVSSFSGSISNCFGTSTERVSGSAKRLSGTQGAGAASIFIKSLSGSISLCDEGAASSAAGMPQGSVSRVNGSIRIEDGASVDRAQTVNGSITVGVAATASEIKTVNGSVLVGDRTRVSGSIGTVNGSITLGKVVDVMGDVSTVNGNIRLANARVHGKLETTNANIDLGEGSRVDGGIHVHGCWSSGLWNNSSCKGNRISPLRVVIRADAVVQGKLKFEREVELYVSDRATIGEVEGAAPIRFAGSEPPR